MLSFQFSRLELLTAKATERHLHCLLLAFSFRLKVLTANQGLKHRLDQWFCQ